MRQGEQYSIAENEAHWPYHTEDDDTSEGSFADLNDILAIVSQVRALHFPLSHSFSHTKIKSLCGAGIGRAWASRRSSSRVVL